ncbi:MAG: hypothetical protein OXH38_05840 [Chloroflexi bacterium]|nr:hypothetical protein [Chloroflexota bacterium]
MTTGSSLDRVPLGAHLVGSVPLSDSESVFREAATRLGDRLRRIPDGETGIRTNWIQWQWPLLAQVAELEAADEEPGPFGPRFRLREGMSISASDLPDTGYRDAALDSWQVFSRLKREGTVSPATRFQVCLPTPLAVTHIRIVPAAQAAVEQAYEDKLLQELDDIVEAIPADQLAVQWDTAVEFALLEGLLDTFVADREPDILERLLRLGSHVPAEVEMGYHLCYGDVEHQHFVQPADTSKLVAIANGVAAGLDRPLNWIHMPVPRDRSDDVYFAPLKDLRLHPETELYLGLVHITDGADGAAPRIEAARRFVADFGVATECGFGRRPAKTIPALLDLHAELAAPIA